MKPDKINNLMKPIKIFISEEERYSRISDVA